tara:strand:- start:4883 stop:5308 length:426 start_codon:yes stop_codon:yes gene_type:complete
MSKDLHFEMRERELGHLISQAESGDIRALGLFAEIKKLKQLYTDAEKELLDLALNQSEEYSEKTFSEDGYLFEKRNGARRFDYKAIMEWKIADANKKEIEIKYKTAFLSYEKNIRSVDDNGELLELPIAKYSNDTLIIKKL